MKMLVLITVFSFVLQADAAITALWFTGSEDSIVRGEVRYFTEDNANFNILGSSVFPFLTRGPYELFDFQVQSKNESSDWWNMHISAPPSHTNPLLGVGMYTEAGRMVRTEGRPEIDFSGRGSGYNRTYGDFEILEIGRDQNNQIDKIAFDFIQLSENHDGSYSGLLVGSFRYNSDLPIPEPSVLSLLPLGLLGLWQRRK